MNSMTGFGRGSHTGESFHAQIEASAVNRKHAEIVIQIPRSLIELETTIKRHVLKTISRGRVSINITLSASQEALQSACFDQEKAHAVEKAFATLGESLGRSLPLTASDFLRIPGILNLNPALPPAIALPVILPALDQAIQELQKMRANEGSYLQDDLTQRLATLRKITHSIEAHAPSVTKTHTEQLHKRLAEISLDFPPDDDRLVKEIALFADRSDITEEITRLHSHLTTFQTYLDASESVGRSLDFLCQEIHREFNTIGSKAHSSDLTHFIVTAKTELEKIREQVQNIE